MQELAALSLFELAFRVVATAAVVIAVTWAVNRFGPLVGGSLSGLPVVIGPGFYFLSLHATPAFVGNAAAHSLWSLCGTQVFILTYMISARRFGVMPSLTCASIAWTTVAVSVSRLPPAPVAGFLVFCLVTAVAIHIGSRLTIGTAPARPSLGWSALLLRGGVAGLLVAVVTTASSRIGPEFSGIFLAFPIGFGVLAVTLHEKLGAANAIGTLNAALKGASGLAVFSAGFALLLPAFSYGWSLALATAISCSLTTALVMVSRLQRGR
ncbi:hypothetical protein GN330_14545 [Nitratireductor sp. CAU 1489]|uniref:Uncharacterized protein n=1 Tax=Nitratireductor arenosus TaxID=2682096 RepID=A0A844QGQ1_9HYPH|nr:hypothetical protein [Nitratireductor arenosus]MVA98465.1 hypothetical protein [Nitratireductor arenosus]